MPPGTPRDRSGQRRSGAELRPHQRETVDALLQHFETGDRAQVTMPCGTGKTLVGVGCAVGLRARLVLLAVPTLVLAGQSARLWRDAVDLRARLLVACSDETVTDVAEVVARTAGATGGATVTTDPAQLGRLLLESTTAELTIVISTYASLDRVHQAAMQSGVHFDLAIGDEAHHCAGEWAAPSTLLARYGAGAFPAHKRLFLTATRRLFPDGDRQRIASMDDEAAFGPVAYRLSLRGAIERRLLSDYRIAVVGVRGQEWSWLAYRSNAPAPGRALAPALSFSADSGHRDLDGARLAALCALGRHIEQSGSCRILSFHNRIEEARSFAAAAPGLLSRGITRKPLRAVAVDGTMPAVQRQRSIAVLDSADTHRPVLLTNVRCLSEGVDLPALDTVIFAGSRSSTIDIIQSVGRVLRPHPGKEVGTVILPVLVPDGPQASDGSKASDRLATSSFAAAFHVLNVLRDHDSELAATLDSARYRYGLAGQRRRPIIVETARLHMALPHGLPETFLRSFELRMVRATTSAWEENVGLLEAWLRESPEAAITTRLEFRGANLGGWIHQQRTLYRLGCLPPARVERLNAIPRWSWNAWDAAWSRTHRILQHHARRHDVARISQRYSVDGVKLGLWVKAQREIYHRGRLRPDRVERLEQVPGWSWRLRGAVEDRDRTPA